MQQYTGSRTHPITAPSLQTALFVVTLGRKIFTMTECAGSQNLVGLIMIAMEPGIYLVSLWVPDIWYLVFIGFTNVLKMLTNVHKILLVSLWLWQYLIFIGFTNIVRSATRLVASITAVSTTIADTWSGWSSSFWWSWWFWSFWWSWWLGIFPNYRPPLPIGKNSQKLVFFLSLMIMIRITCQYTGHCCMLPLSLHKRRVAGRWQQHLGRVCTSGSCFWNFGAPLCTLKVEKNLGQCTMEKTLKVQQNSLQRGFSPGEIMAELRSRKIQGDFLTVPTHSSY